MDSRSGSIFAVAICLLLICFSQGVSAGPPFLTDDPEPTETGHWEIYAPLIETTGRSSDIEGAAGVELNYGALPNLQLTLGLPAHYTHDSTGWRWGVGDAELSAKYRIFKSEAAGLQVALFPKISLPTASNGMGSSRVSALLPLWIQKDAGPWSIFGGGGYAINPGTDNQNYWTGGMAVTRRFGERLLLGVEANRQGADTIQGHASTSLGLGGIYQLQPPFRLLASGGPTFEKNRPTGFHAFLALGLDF